MTVAPTMPILLARIQLPLILINNPFTFPGDKCEAQDEKRNSDDTPFFQ